MNIHPLWFICIFIRLSLLLIIRYIIKLNKKKYVRYFLSSILLLFGIGFMYKGMTGSNNETQIIKVFWHETRYIHGILYILSSIYLFNNNLNMCSLLLLSDLLFSISYRVFLKK